MRPEATRERWPAVVLNLAWPGLGQLSVGRTFSGWAFISMTAIALLVAFAAPPGSAVRWFGLASAAELLVWSTLAVCVARDGGRETSAA